MSSKIKNIIIIGVVAIVLVLIYIFFIKKGPDATTLLTTPSGAPATNETGGSATNEVNPGFLSVLLSVKNIKLDESIFKNSAFASLKDSSIVLTQDGTEGRVNPFAPIGTEPTSINTSGETNQQGIVEITNPLDTTGSLPVVIPTPAVSVDAPAASTDTKTGTDTKKN